MRDIAQGKTIQDAHEDLSALAAFTGIEFDHVTNLLLPVSSPLTRRYSFRGRAHGLSFRLQVDVRDDNLEILHIRPSLSPELTLVLNDFLHGCARLIYCIICHLPHHAYPPFNPLIRIFSVQKERALRLFFKGFANFARAASERHYTFTAIKVRH